MIIKKLAKFSDYLESKGLKKEADALMNMLEEDMLLEEEDLAEEALIPMEDEVIEFSEQGVDMNSEEVLDEEMPEGVVAPEEMGGEFKFEGQSTQNFHCCPEAHDAMTTLCDMAASEEEIDFCMELMEELDSFLGDKIALMESGGSKEDLCELMNKSLSAMYCVGQASGIMDEDVANSFQFVADAIDEVCSELLEE